jgi:hypothetical protein
MPSTPESGGCSEIHPNDLRNLLQLKAEWNFR